MKEKKIESHSINLSADHLSILDSVICKVEVDLTGWLSDLSGQKNWEILSESENENYIIFFLKQESQNAEVTLYNSGYAIVDIDGKAVFHGDIIGKKAGSASLNYYNIESGEKILLN
ncbi:hypothetical protein N9O74_04025 [Methylophilaceae bacterium]|nr:hypothetical protein [Methylophilaceae bacterium]|tara:strand:+ start:24773 stop:25123 length:351 start_codon:yes stop_codon:yes gene_type:complete